MAAKVTFIITLATGFHIFHFLSWWSYRDVSCIMMMSNVGSWYTVISTYSSFFAIFFMSEIICITKWRLVCSETFPRTESINHFQISRWPKLHIRLVVMVRLYSMVAGFRDLTFTLNTAANPKRVFIYFDLLYGITCRRFPLLPRQHTLIWQVACFTL